MDTLRLRIEAHVGADEAKRREGSGRGLDPEREGLVRGVIAARNPGGRRSWLLRVLAAGERGDEHETTDGQQESLAAR
jgi:hypothetical protein